jgi:Uma2 family endonuclease
MHAKLMTVSVKKPKKISEAQYLKMERAAEFKSELRDGRAYAMAGASERHNLITVSILVSLHRQIGRRPCRVYPSDMRVKAAVGFYTYPDISVVCGRPEFADDTRDTLLNPTVIVEVLSPSTANYDRGEKFERYRQLPSLSEYLLISQTRPLVEHYVRQPDGKWLLTEYRELSDVVELPSIGCRLALSEIYEQVTVIKEEGPVWDVAAAEESS